MPTGEPASYDANAKLQNILLIITMGVGILSEKLRNVCFATELFSERRIFRLSFCSLSIGNKCRIFKICERRRIDDDVTGRRDRIHGNMPRAQRIWCGRLDRDFGVAGDEITIQ